MHSGASTEMVEQWLHRVGIMENVYFLTLRDRTMDRDQFCRTQKQFFHAVQYFPRPMAALMARRPDSTARAALAHNIAEEHGLVDDEGGSHSAFEPTLAHDRTFLKFLGTLGVPLNEALATPSRPPVQAFNVALMGACTAEPVDTALGCLGVIEYAFADISALIGQVVVERGWIEAASLVHYKTHAMIDKRHASEFFEATDSIRVEQQLNAEVERGIALGLYLFNRLYEDLYHDAREIP